VADEERAAPRRKRRGRAADSGPEQDDETVRDSGGGDDGRGDEGRGDEGRGDEGRGDEGRGDEGRGDEGRGDEGRGDEGPGDEGGGKEPGERQEASDAGRDDGDREGNGVPAAAAARRAARYVADFTGRHPESIVSVDRHDGDWQVGVEVVESRRIPDTTDVLAIYEVRLDGGGRLVSYRRTRRYTRGQLDKECR
jgi:hypothetical protein